MNSKFTELMEIFNIPGKIYSIEPISNGNINLTYDVMVADNGKKNRYVFQRINVFVFKYPNRIMKNIEKITTYIDSQLEQMGKDRDCVMHFAHTSDGKNYYMEEQGFWRISKFVPHGVTYNCCDDLDKLRSAGRAFGEFQTMLADFDASLLYETIPNFHNTRSRIAVLMRHFNEDPCGRSDEVAAEIERIKQYKPLGVKLCEMLDAEMLPLRVTHNDTKINNVIFDSRTNEAKTVIDLDTVMPGLVAYDFGDAVRFACNEAAEDERDTSLVKCNMERFRAIAEGFVPEVAPQMDDVELHSLSLGAFVMTLELAVRFLDDYITGDQYFKTLYRGHNLVRTRAQLALADDIHSKLDEMDKIVMSIAKKKTAHK